MKEDVRLLSVIDSCAKHAKLLYYIYIGFLLYLVITAFSVKDTQLAVDDISSGCPEKLTHKSYKKWQEARLVPGAAVEETTL